MNASQQFQNAYTAMVALQIHGALSLMKAIAKETMTSKHTGDATAAALALCCLGVPAAGPVRFLPEMGDDAGQGSTPAGIAPQGQETASMGDVALFLDQAADAVAGMEPETGMVGAGVGDGSLAPITTSNSAPQGQQSPCNILAVSAENGRFAPRRFAQAWLLDIPAEDRDTLGIPAEGIAALLDGPGNLQYWQAWDEIRTYAIIPFCGHWYDIHQADDGAIWLVPRRPARVPAIPHHAR